MWHQDLWKKRSELWLNGDAAEIAVGRFLGLIVDAALSCISKLHLQMGGFLSKAREKEQGRLETEYCPSFLLDPSLENCCRPNFLLRQLVGCI